jgi:hypothetical protein
MHEEKGFVGIQFCTNICHEKGWIIY